MIKVRLKKIHPDAIMPTNKQGDSGWDVYALKDCVICNEDGVIAVPTGLMLASISPGFEIQVRSRSGNTAKKHVVVANQPGTIDNSYRGEIIVLLHALNRDVFFKRGEKIAQLVPMAVPEAEFSFSDEVTETERGAGGFGSTGA